MNFNAYDLGTWLNDNAGAVQALVAILALGLSIYVPYRLDAKARRRADDERRLQAHAMAVAVYPELAVMRESFTPRAKLWDDYRRGVNAGGKTPLDWFKIDAPPILDASLDRLYLLGDPAGTTLTRIVAFLRLYNRKMDELLEQDEAGVKVEMAKASDQVSALVIEIGKLLQLGKEQLDSIHDGKISV